MCHRRMMSCQQVYETDQYTYECLYIYYMAYEGI